MKLRLKTSTLIKIALILGLLAIAPFLVPFTLDFIIVADLMGLEALIVILLTYSKSMFNFIRLRGQELCSHMTQTAILVAELYVFKPRVYLIHATASSLVIVCASSVLLACVVWMPVMLVSAGFMGV